MKNAQRYIQEASKLDKSADGSYRVRLIDEGTGSSGVYSAGLLKESVHVFEGVPSFINHPINADKPHERDLNSIAGRITNVTVEEDATGRTALFGTYTPRAEYASLFEQFGDIIGLSIFCGASGTPREDGRLDVQEFNASDPYRSVDAVVAAGRGGRFERAQESLRAIESSLGTPEGTKPGSTSAPDTHQQEESHMDEKILAAIEALTTLITGHLQEQKDAAEKQRQAEADAEAGDKDVTEAVEKAIASVEAVKAANLLPSLEKSLIEAAKRGDDISSGLETAKGLMSEAAAANKPAAPQSYVHESAKPADQAHDYTIGRLIGVN